MDRAGQPEIETRVDLMDLKAVDRIDPRLFDPSARLERRW